MYITEHQNLDSSVPSEGIIYCTSYIRGMYDFILETHSSIAHVVGTETIQKYYLWNCHYLHKTFVNHVNRRCHNQITE